MSHEEAGSESMILGPTYYVAINLKDTIEKELLISQSPKNNIPTNHNYEMIGVAVTVLELSQENQNLEIGEKEIGNELVLYLDIARRDRLSKNQQTLESLAVKRLLF